LCCDRLYRKLQGKACIIDDESYFTLTHGTINGNDNFYSSDVNRTSASTKYRTASKYEAKIMVWVCISEKGISSPYYLPSGLAINQVNYLHECIEKRLVPFINQHHSDGEYLFWPDLAGAHYANSVLDYLDRENINYVRKQDNPPNVPEARPVEDFWSILKGLVYEKNWKAENLDQLKGRIQRCLKKINKEFVKRLAGATRRRVGLIRRKDVIEKNVH
jgi:hypothetical protein